MNSAQLIARLWQLIGPQCIKSKSSFSVTINHEFSSKVLKYKEIVIERLSQYQLSIAGNIHSHTLVNSFNWLKLIQMNQII